MKQLIKFIPFLQKYVHEILKAGIELRAFAVYGSVIREEMSPISDVDVKIFILRNKEKKDVLEIEKKINSEILKCGFKNIIHSIIEVKPVTEHIGDGVLLYGRPLVSKLSKEELNENELITYDTTNLDSRKRVSLSIRLFGHELKRKVNKKNKIYKTEGILKVYKGKRLRNAILINKKDAGEIKKIFEEFEVPFKSSYIYMEKYGEFIEKGSA